MSAHKVGKLSIENASECLQKIGNECNPQYKQWARDHGLLSAIINISTFLKDDQTYTKLFVIKSLSDILTTSAKGHLVLECHDELNDVCTFLIKTCQSGELLQISYALDCFYEIFSEGYYDQILRS